MKLFDDYEQMCRETAIYPREVEAPYLALGLCSEAAELEECEDHPEDFIKELGDVQWYTCRLANHYGVSFAEIARYTGPVDKELVILAGLIAGAIKKQLRDGHTWSGEQREEQRQKIIELLNGVVTVSAGMVDRYDEVLLRNIEKLRSRQQRGVLRGSGDNR